jgi:acetyl esterase/lipase
MLLLCLFVACALFAPRPRAPRPWSLSFWFAYLVNELPFLTFFWLVAATALAAAEGDLATPGGVVGIGIAAVTAAGLIVVVHRATRTRPALDAALADALGVATPARRRRHPLSRWVRIVLWPFPWWFRRDVERSVDIAYGPDRFHRLDVFRPTRRPASGPILIHLHGGAFRVGRKGLEGRPLVNRLVSQGWVCVSANYRLGRDVEFPDQLVDVKRVIAWTKHHATECGADPDQVYVAGSSAGGHLASLAGLTPSDPRFQPGFEGTDTGVVAVISFYGYYGPIATRSPPSSPHD